MRRIVFIIIGSLLILGVVGAVGYYAYNQANAAKSVVSDADLASVQKGTLVATVTSTGAIEPIQQSSVGFGGAGTVKQINVKSGDLVKKGQVLATLDTRELELQLAQADANVASAQAKLDQIQRGPNAADVAAAQQNLTSAQAAYDKLIHPDRNDLIAAKSDIDKAKAAVDQAQAAYDRIGGATNPYIGMTPQAAQLQSATLDYQKALALYNSKINPSEAQLQQALANIKTAQSQIAKLQPANEDISAAQANVKSAVAARDLAKEHLNDMQITAPFDGTVTKQDLNPGAFAPAGQGVITVADLSQLRVTVNVDETDISRVQVGMPVKIDLDALPGVAATGKVSEISAGASTVQGVVNYTVKILLDKPDPQLRLGMTTNINIEVARKDNVLLVPNRGIRASGNKRLASVYDGQSVRETEVKLGLSNDQESEVISGLGEGERVFVGTVPQGIPGFNAQMNSNR